LQTGQAGKTDKTMPIVDTAETVFPAVPESVGAARRFTRAALHRHSIAPETVDIAILLVSELATNAIVHAVSNVRLRVRVGADVRVEVCDISEQAPEITPGEPERESGRGLELVSTLADGWDWSPSAEGKVVWFALARG
jgi:anti-sigma regulatory factor (Ser/Thr protein kinase)